ncbi:hypothetical protein CRE_11532 [Caenorhabditis remanei]|uniref:Uncharacterized protein n=1 Tax=Caenorhabditis remanei TaxID=31234 RepID=E3NME0_CAERE|nr:hypothetical protein CRE_11532 [Caenorhabditis remanei]
MLIRAVFALLLASTATAHIKLVYPPARAPALDFYSSSNSQPPCGVPKPAAGEGVRTFMKAGSTIEMSWFVAVPHMVSIEGLGGSLTSKTFLNLFPYLKIVAKSKSTPTKTYIPQKESNSGPLEP